jgi:hypothetical protein
MLALTWFRCAILDSSCSNCVHQLQLFLRLFVSKESFAAMLFYSISQRTMGSPSGYPTKLMLCTQKCGLKSLQRNFWFSSSTYWAIQGPHFTAVFSSDSPFQLYLLLFPLRTVSIHFMFFFLSFPTLWC